MCDKIITYSWDGGVRMQTLHFPNVDLSYIAGQ